MSIALPDTRAGRSRIRLDAAEEPLESAESALILASLGLLFLTCIDAEPVRNLAVLCWLVSFGLLALWNVGAALGLYVSAVALYSNLFFSGTFSLFERPDHPALLILLTSLLFFQPSGRAKWTLDWTTMSIGAFLVYGVMNGFLNGTFSNATVAAFARTLGIPLVMFVAITNARSRPKDLWSFFLVMFLLASYSCVLSVLWQVEELRGLSFPAWIMDPEVNRWIDSIRSGGVLMQPAWNGLQLSLAFCMVYLAYYRWVFGLGRVLLLVLAGAILLSVYLTYTRGVYLGALAAVVGLLWMRTGDGKHIAAMRLGLVLTGLIGMFLMVFAQPSTLEGRIGDESTVLWRFEIWKIALDMIPSKPLFGYGFHGYGENAAEFLGNSDILTRSGLEINEPAVHNTFLNVTIELGLIGFLLYALVHVLILFAMTRSCHRLWGRFGVYWALIFVGVYFIAAQFAVTLEPTTNLMLYGTMGLLAGMTTVRHGAPRRDTVS
ncbi:MAG: O-antigen ligase family protein [Gemmatimonadota bacterium]